MKKNLLFVVLVAACAAAIGYKVADKAPSADLAADDQMLAIIESAGCMDCHSASPNLPFYASLPVAGDLVKADAEKGYRAYNIEPTVKALKEGGLVNEVSVAMIERVLLKGTMSPAKYYLVHWGAAINDTERDMAMEWANETIRPIPDSLAVDSRKVELGKLLFHDGRLSLDNTISCASCHNLETGGVDNKQYSEGVGGQFGGVNAPTVFNAYFNFVQFWDGRAATLADQAAGPPLNPVEMASESFEQICAKLQADENMVKMFAEIYPDGITEANITNAIQEFEMTLLTPNSPFDRYLKGDNDALSAEEIEGYDLFKENGCATCHAGETLGGKTYEYMGRFDNYFEKRGLEMTEEDNGRFKQTKDEYDRHCFKVPGLRNLALTAPYFHDGTMKTIEEAVQAMAHYECGVDLTEQDNQKISAFMRSLTGEYKAK